MIYAHMTRSGRIVAYDLPVVGETINVKDFGPARVVALTHDSIDNYITLTMLETLVGEYTETHRFRVELKLEEENDV